MSAALNIVFFPEGGARRRSPLHPVLRWGALTMTAAGTTRADDRSVARRKIATARSLPTDRTFVRDLMQRARPLFRDTAELGQVIGRPMRTAQRYVAEGEGARLPDALSLLRIVRSRVGAAFVGEMVRDLPSAERRDFFFGIMREATRADGL